jgi:CBS domain-containing protein
MDTVRRWMSSPALVVDESMPLPDVRRRLEQQRVRRLPVVNAAGQLVGIVTEGDVNRVSDSHVTDVRDYSLYHRVTDLPIGEIMTRVVVTVTPDTSIMEVAQLLLDHRIGGVPVVEQGRIVGMITESDLFRLIVIQQAEVTDQVREFGVHSPSATASRA